METAMAAVLVLILLSAPVMAVRGWLRWLHQAVHFDPPRWRSVLAFLGLIAVSSALLATAGAVAYIKAKGGPFKEGRLAPSTVDMGFWTCAFALGSAAVGKGPQRWHVGFTALVLLGIWAWLEEMM
jgi:hypothetical protein